MGWANHSRVVSEGSRHEDVMGSRQAVLFASNWFLSSHSGYNPCIQQDSFYACVQMIPRAHVSQSLCRMVVVQPANACSISDDRSVVSAKFANKSGRAL